MAKATDKAIGAVYKVAKAEGIFKPEAAGTEPGPPCPLPRPVGEHARVHQYRGIPVMTPDDILRHLARDDGLPREALRAAAEQRAQMVPLFLAQIEEYLAATAGQREQKSRALFFIFHLLGEWREKSAYRPLARLLQVPPAELDPILGDGTTSTSHRVMAAVCDGDPQPLFDVILDAQADEYVRSRMCEALAMLVHGSALPRQQIARFLRDGFMNIQPQSQCFVWHGWQSAIAMTGLVELSPLVKKAFDRGFIDRTWMNFEHFEEDMRKGVQRDGGDPGLSEDDDYSLFGNTVEELSSWYGFSEQRRADRERQRQARKQPDHAGQTASNPFRGVGRNDPCPCGSGRKFKKCCLP